MKQKLVGYLVSVLMFATVLSVAGTVNNSNLLFGVDDYIMAIENTYADPGDIEHIIQINGTWADNMIKAMCTIEFDPTMIEIDSVNAEGSVDENANLVMQMLEDDLFKVYFIPENYLDPDEGKLFNLVVNITGGVGITELKFKRGDHTNYYHTVHHSYIWDPILIDGRIVIGENSPPETPEKPSGPTEGEPGVVYNFSTVTTDPDDHDVKYGWDWNGDMTVDEWTDFYESGEPISTPHVFTSAGTFEIRAKAKDEYNAQSDWSEPLIIEIKEPELEIGKISGGLSRVKAEIKNVGNAEAKNVNFYINVSGGMLGLINISTEGSILTINPEDSENVRTEGLLFGLGKISVNVTAYADDVDKVIKTADGFILFIYVLIT